MKKLVPLLALCLSSCFQEEPKSKFENPNIRRVILEKGERLEHVSFRGIELYVITAIDTTPPKTHYVQKFSSTDLNVQLVIEEQ